MSKKATKPAAAKPAKRKPVFIPLLVANQKANADEHYQEVDRNQARRSLKAAGEVVENALGLAEEKLVGIVEKLDQAFAAAAEKLSHFQLEEIEVNLEVSASGEIGLKFIGSVQTEGKGSITLKLKRKA
jgi:protein involved in polysaccharide export with SLBB domain